MSEQDTQAVEATSSTNEVEVVAEESTTEDVAVESTEQEVEETVPKSQFNQVLARAKKAEALLKNKPKEATPITNSPSDEVIEEKVLLSQGMSEELLGELKALAKVRGKSLISTQNDPIFIAIKKTKEDEAKAIKAKLGASKGSGTVKKEATINTPGLSDADHKAKWREMMGR